MARPNRITSSSFSRSKEVKVVFGDGYINNLYYTHATQEFGEPTDKEGTFTMWGWINHLRHKIWWNESLENDFIRECKKYL